MTHLFSDAEFDFTDIRGMTSETRLAVEIAAAGRHPLLLVGPPGSGATLIARRFTTILPPLTDEERMERDDAMRAAGLMNADGTHPHGDERPFRAPHHTVSLLGIRGQRPQARPGEIGLSRHGVLFLDDVTEFATPVLDAIWADRDPRWLIATALPCPCGWRGQMAPAARPCMCSLGAVERYQRRLVTIMRHFEISAQLQLTTHAELRDKPPCPSSGEMRARVIAARAILTDRSIHATTAALLKVRP